MIAILFVLGVVGLVGIVVLGIAFAKVKELHDWGYSWSYSFLQVLGGL